VHIYYVVLSMLLALPADADREIQQAVWPPHATRAPSRAVPESIPTAHDRLLPRAKPTLGNWMLSVEGATRVPVDVGVQVTLESPFHLRFSASYGWVPAAFSGLFTGIASSTSSNAEVSAILDHASYQGRTFRTAIGVRPFTTGGLHLDVGYARLSLDGALDLASSGVAILEAQGGGYQAHTTVDAWLVEIGSQVEGWGLVLGFAFGLMRTYAAQTSINAVNGALANPSLGSAAQQTDAALKTYGYVPTLTLRLGFDFLSVRTWASDPGSHG
jgi:hypothetical protein